jgi:hypothetical protein
LSVAGSAQNQLLDTAKEMIVEEGLQSFTLTQSQAELVASMSSGASIAAAQYARRARVNREKTIDNVLA